MKLRADGQGRIACRELFPPRAAFEASKQADGSIRIVELMEKPAPKARIVVVKGRKYLTSDRPVTLADTQEVMANFP